MGGGGGGGGEKEKKVQLNFAGGQMYLNIYTRL